MTFGQLFDDSQSRAAFVSESLDAPVRVQSGKIGHTDKPLTFGSAARPTLRSARQAPLPHTDCVVGAVEDVLCRKDANYDEVGRCERGLCADCLIWLVCAFTTSDARRWRQR